MSTTPSYINQRINNLQAQINSIISGGGGGVPTSSGLATVLGNGNTAGLSDIDMTNNNITNINQLSLFDPLLPNETATLDNQSFYINTSGGLTTTQVAILQTQIEVLKDTLTGEGTVLNANELIFQNQTIGSNITSNTGIVVTPTFQFDLNAGGEITFDTVGGSISSNASSAVNLTAGAGGNIYLNSTTNDITLTANTNVNITSVIDSVAILANDNITLTATNGSLALTSTTNTIDLLSSTATTINADSISMTTIGNDITLTSGSNIINLNSYNVNSFNFAMPICFTRQRSDTFSYSLGLQQLENVYTTSFALPFEFTGGSSYTSTNWKIDFALNTWNNTVVNDKGLACYFALRDTSLNFYLPDTYNATTPYVNWIQPSLYNDGTNSAFQNFNWSDRVDLAGLVGQGSGATPLDLLLVFAADSAFTCNFNINVSLTRTNKV